MTHHEDILKFWFEDLEPKDWWAGGDAVDQQIIERFGDTVEKALRGELYSWRTAPEGRLAEVICLDQFTRNMFRGTSRAFSGDSAALTLAQEAVLSGADKSLTTPQCSFLYMPFMHAESLSMHTWARKLFGKPGLEGVLPSLADHTQVIEQFGRYPSRNASLGRTSTPEELIYLENGKSWGQS